MRLNFLFVLAFLSSSIFAGQVIIPSQPKLDVKAFILVDADSKKILAAKNIKQKFAPASLTKMMSMYVVSNALFNKQINLHDKVLVSKHAWEQKGSRMFVKFGSKVSVQNLIKGTVVASGNDSTMALAEYSAGSEFGFVDMMNNAAEQMHLENTHFMNPTGMPFDQHYSSAQDLSVIAGHLIKDFPEYYHWYKQKWFTYNKIKQPNRNRLLWRDPLVDGLKTGHTESAGYCLVASAKYKGMRLIAVVLGAKSDLMRNTAAKQLFDYGFRFYQTKQLSKDKQVIAKIKTWQGDQDYTLVGLLRPMFITYPKGADDGLRLDKVLPKSISAPVLQGKVVGDVKVFLENNVIAQQSLIALNSVRSGGKVKNILDVFRSWFSG